MLESFNGSISLSDDGFEITGPQSLKGGVIDSMGDHRIAMSATISAGIAS